MLASRLVLGLLPAQQHLPSHREALTYASLHLLALYVAMVGQLPGLGLLQRCREAVCSSGVLQGSSMCRTARVVSAPKAVRVHLMVQVQSLA